MNKKIMAVTLALAASLSFPAFAKVETKSAAIANIEMEWPYIKGATKAATKAINADIRTYMDDFRYDYIAKKFLSGRTWFETAYEDEELASVILYDLRNDGKDNTTTLHAMVYDLKTGQRIPLQNVCKLTVQDLVDRAGTNFYRDGYVHIKPKKMPTRVPEDYVLTNSGGIAVYFQVNEVGDLLDGNVTARFTPEEIREINAKHSTK
jgi:hypothetical protein